MQINCIFEETTQKLHNWTYRTNNLVRSKENVKKKKKEKKERKPQTTNKTTLLKTSKEEITQNINTRRYQQLFRQKDMQVQQRYAS